MAVSFSIKTFLKNIIYQSTSECVEDELKVNVTYHYEYGIHSIKKQVSVSNVPRKGDYINMITFFNPKEYEVEKVIFEMYGGVANIYLK